MKQKSKMKQKLKYDKFGVPMIKRLNFCARINRKGVNANYLRLAPCGARDCCICSMYMHRGRRLYFPFDMNRIRNLMDMFRYSVIRHPSPADIRRMTFPVSLKSESNNTRLYHPSLTYGESYIPDDVK